MNNYETFRDELSLEMSVSMMDVDHDTIQRFLAVVDSVARSFNIEKQSHEIISYDGGIPKLVKMFIASMSVEQLSMGTLQNYLLTLKNFFLAVGKSPQEVTSNDIRVYMNQYQMQRGVKSNTMDTMRHEFNSFFSWCYNEEYITKDPTKKIKQIKCEYNERVFLDMLELEYLRNACVNVREKAIIDFLFSTGCRCSEMCKMKLDQVDFERKNVKVICGKGKKSRTTFLNAEAVVSIQSYLKTRTDGTDLLFAYPKSHKGNWQMCNKSVEMLIDRIASRVPQIKKHITPHVLRHTAATNAIRSGMPIEQVKEFMGHSNINTTLIYAKLLQGDVKRSHEMCFG